MFIHRKPVSVIYFRLLSSFTNSRELVNEHNKIHRDIIILAFSLPGKFRTKKEGYLPSLLGFKISDSLVISLFLSKYSTRSLTFS